MKKLEVPTESLYQAARNCLLSCSVEEKLNLTDETASAWNSGRLCLSGWTSADDLREAGHPAKPELVHPRHLSRRRLGSEKGRLALIHAIAHIEFNAINLAWDAVQRFPDLPADFYSDWIQVAQEEVYHFRLLRERLRDGGVDYGDFPAHNGLWDMAVQTAHDPLVRMALVPRMLEARGLDVTPGIMQRFAAIGDERTVEVLQVILDEEVGHVHFGTRWFRYLCEARGLEPEATYFDLLSDFVRGGIRCPLHHQARRQAGFTEEELNRLERLCAEE
ncbi:MAG: ferritin-like domain-containing protein [Candidatus Thiodiazotropha sp. (ex Monitilora ramsayi)]|nr:ferritin-like domain-containing protein [Candidatus Thiodiazotropha sp. (ex Monitilora ramsayi)]